MAANISPGWILAAIDGTLSEDYFEHDEPQQPSNQYFTYTDLHRRIPVKKTLQAATCKAQGTARHKSFTFRFFEDFKSKKKNYWPGPPVSSLDADPKARSTTCNHQGVETLSRDVTHWVRKAVDGEIVPLVVLVGHSRGGWVAIDVAKKLQDANVPVYLIALYDAVDMSLGADHSVIANNVNFVYHAYRHPDLGSRRATTFGRATNWKNTGRRSKKPTVYVEQGFAATHGNLGGAPPSWCFTGGAGLSEDKCNYSITPAQNHSAAMAADAFIRRSVRSRGLPLGIQGDIAVKKIQEYQEKMGYAVPPMDVQ